MLDFRPIADPVPINNTSQVVDALEKKQSVILCPCCGNEYATSIPVVDLDTNTVSWNGDSVKLRLMDAELLSILVAQRGKVVSHESIIIRMWGSGEPDTARLIIKVRVCTLRKAVAVLGIQIQSVIGRGYRAVF